MHERMLKSSLCESLCPRFAASTLSRSFASFVVNNIRDQVPFSFFEPTDAISIRSIRKIRDRSKSVKPLASFVDQNKHSRYPDITVPQKHPKTSSPRHDHARVGDSTTAVSPTRGFAPFFHPPPNTPSKSLSTEQQPSFAWYDRMGTFIIGPQFLFLVPNVRIFEWLRSTRKGDGHHKECSECAASRAATFNFQFSIFPLAYQLSWFYVIPLWYFFRN